MATTYGEMLDRIADETRYTGSAERDIFKLCIQDAIAHYEVERFWWNEARALTFNTVANQRNYGVLAHADIPYILQFDIVTLARSATDIYELTKQDYVQDEAYNADGQIIGQPYYYSYFSQNIWLDSIPNAVYAVRVSGLFKLAALSADADTNAWTTLGEGEEMIRQRAKANYYIDYMRLADSDPLVVRALNKMTAAYSRLKVSTHRRVGTNQIRGYL